MFLALLFIILLFRLSISGWSRGRLFGKSDDFATEDQFMADDTTRRTSDAIVRAARWVSGLELATHGTLKWLKRSKLGIERVHGR